ncbi:MAG: PrpF domain-containing protein, partial [Streptosporangiales bacterium]
GKMMSMGKVHRAYPMTGAICTVVAAGIPGTVVHETMPEDRRGSESLRLGHPSGRLQLYAAPRRAAGEWTVDQVSVERTARRLMEGTVLVPDSTLKEV